MRIAGKFLLVVVALLIVSQVIPGIHVSGLYPAVIAALLIGVVNLTIKPLLLLLTLPLSILTLGLFALVINGFLFWFVASFVEGFSVSGFTPAFLGALAVSFINWLGNRLFE